MSAFSRKLVDTCTVQRGSDAPNGLGEPIKNLDISESWVDVVTNLPCRFVVQKEDNADRSQSPSGLQKVVILLLMVLPDADVRSGDRIINIITDGQTLSGPYLVEQEVPRRNYRGKHHKSLILEKVS